VVPPPAGTDRTLVDVAGVSGAYWHHQRRIEPHPAVHDRRFQDGLLEALAHVTATRVG
jgi:hypothetical protein